MAAASQHPLGSSFLGTLALGLAVVLTSIWAERAGAAEQRLLAGGKRFGQRAAQAQALVSSQPARPRLPTQQRVLQDNLAHSTSSPTSAIRTSGSLSVSWAERG